jgi:hypothetical protein
LLITIDDSLPVASGLSGEWVKTKKAKSAKRSPTEVTQCMDDKAALSTRPDYPPSPTKFDRRAADAKFATVGAGAGQAARRNVVCNPPFSSSLILNLIVVACCSCLGR